MIIQIDLATGKRTQSEDVAPSFPVSREAFRETATLPKSQFCMAMADAGVLTDDEAITAAKGDWPDSFEAAIVELTAIDQRNVKVRWAAAAIVDRDDPVLELLRLQTQLTPEDLDAMFGYTVES